MLRRLFNVSESHHHFKHHEQAHLIPSGTMFVQETPKGRFLHDASTENGPRLMHSLRARQTFEHGEVTGRVIVVMIIGTDYFHHICLSPHRRTRIRACIVSEVLDGVFILCMSVSLPRGEDADWWNHLLRVGCARNPSGQAPRPRVLGQPEKLAVSCTLRERGLVAAGTG